MEKENQIRVILFDLGGVLVEVTGLQPLLSWMGNRMTPDELLAEWLSSPVVRAFETGQLHPEEFAKGLIEEFALPVAAEEFLQEFTYWARRLFPGALQLVQRIPAEYLRATLCNTNALHWPRLMNDLQLATAFDRHFASHIINRIKPDEGAFQHVIEAWAIPPQRSSFWMITS